MSSRQSYPLDSLTLEEKNEIVQHLKESREEGLKAAIKERVKYVSLTAVIDHEGLIDAALKVERKKILVEALKELIQELER